MKRVKNQDMTAKEFQQIAHTIPHQPGIYKYFDARMNFYM